MSCPHESGVPNCSPITTADLDTLVYVEGRNAQGCIKFAPMPAASAAPTACSIGALAAPGVAVSYVGRDAGGCLVSFTPPAVHPAASLTNNAAPFAWNGATQVGNIPQVGSLSYNPGTRVLTFTPGDGSAPTAIDLSALATDINLQAVNYNALTGDLTFQETAGGDTFTVNLSSLIPITTAAGNGTAITGNGTTGSPLSVAVLPDPAVGNVLTVSAAGAFVPSLCVQLGATTAAASIPAGATILYRDGAGNCGRAPLPAAVPSGVSTDANNILVNGSDGRAWLDCETVQDCVAPMFAPWGVYNDATNLVALTPSTDAGNAFSLGTDGRPFVAGSATPFITSILDTQTVDHAVAAGVLSSAVRVSSDPGNILQIDPTPGTGGLFVGLCNVVPFPAIAGLSGFGLAVVNTSNGCLEAYDMCDLLGRMDTATDTNVPAGADLLYIRADNTCGRAPMPVVSVDACALGAEVPNTSLASTRNYNFVVNETIAGQDCFTTVPGYWRVQGDAAGNIRQVRPDDKVQITGDVGGLPGGIAVTLTPNTDTGVYKVSVAFDPCSVQNVVPALADPLDLAGFFVSDGAGCMTHMAVAATCLDANEQMVHGLGWNDVQGWHFGRFAERKVVRRVSGTYTLNAEEDNVLLVNNAAAATINLVAPTACQRDDFHIKLTQDAGANVTINAPGGQVIVPGNGAAAGSFTLTGSAGRVSLHLVFDGASEWHII